MTRNTARFMLAFQDEMEAYGFRASFLRDFPDVSLGLVGRICQPKNEMPEVEDFLAAMRPPTGEVVATYYDHDCDGSVTTYRLFVGTSFLLDGREGELSGNAPWHFDGDDLIEVREASAEEVRLWTRLGFRMPEYVVFRDEDWYPWVEDDTIGIPALDSRYDDEIVF